MFPDAAIEHRVLLYLAPKLASDRLAQHGRELDEGSTEGPEGRRKPHLPVRDGIGRDGAKRISRPPRSTDPAPLLANGGIDLARAPQEQQENESSGSASETTPKQEIGVHLAPGTFTRSACLVPAPTGLVSRSALAVIKSP